MQIIQCTERDLDVVSELFNDYRIFYEQESDLLACREFLKENLEKQRSKIFLLIDDSGRAVAFSQLYPAICSIAMKPYYYLSDLYVRKDARQHGHAQFLMSFLADHFSAEGMQRLTLDTATTNKIAQHLYESLGYEREEVYITYHQMLRAK
jgi:ribosomal protein S18 acetylase RimI-like enzyme